MLDPIPLTIWWAFQGQGDVLSKFFFSLHYFTLHKARHKAKGACNRGRKDRKKEKQLEEEQTLIPRTYQHPFLLSSLLIVSIFYQSSYCFWFCLNSPLAPTQVFLHSFFLMTPSFLVPQLLTKNKQSFPRPKLMQ